MNFVVCFSDALTLLTSKRPKLYAILTFLSAIGLRVNYLYVGERDSPVISLIRSIAYKSVLKFSDPTEPPDKCRMCPADFVFLMSLLEILVFIPVLTNGDGCFPENGEADKGSSLVLFIA